MTIPLRTTFKTGAHSPEPFKEAKGPYQGPIGNPFESHACIKGYAGELDYVSVASYYLTSARTNFRGIAGSACKKYACSRVSERCGIRLSTCDFQSRLQGLRREVLGLRCYCQGFQILSSGPRPHATIQVASPEPRTHNKAKLRLCKLGPCITQVIGIVLNCFYRQGP